MKYIFTLLLLASLVFSPEITQAQESEWPELDKSPLQFSYYPSNAAWRNYLDGDDRNMQPKIKVMYSAPGKKGREVFGNLVPFGSEWRLGANEATEITFYNAVELNGKTVPRGTYTMFADVNEDHWVINISKERHIWGGENRDKSMDVARVKVPTEDVLSIRETLAIGFKEINENLAHMIIEWDGTRVQMPIAFNVTSFPGEDVSIGDSSQYPDNSRFRNYLKPEQLEAAQPIARVTYGRPLKNDRDIFGGLLKYGEVWRVGANESTELSLFKDVKIGGKEVKSGRYNVYALVNEAEWTIILNTDIPAWGSANRNEEKDAYTFKVPVTQDKESLEALSIIFREKDANNFSMVIGWDTTRAELPMSH